METTNQLLMTNRRDFIKVSATTVGALSLSMLIPGCSNFRPNALKKDGNWNANAWLEITPDNRVIFTLDRVEMGQGTFTGLTTLLAEELDVQPSNIEVVFAPSQTVYRNPDYGLQLTGGSNSLSSSWTQIREAGALARHMIVAAASNVLNVPKDQLRTDNAFVTDSASNRNYSYGSLAKLASKQAIPSDILLKDSSEFKFIGKQNKRLDSLLKVTGKAVYGIDADVAGMRYAVVSRAPWIGACYKKHNGDEVASMAGVEKIIEIESGIAIVARSYWAARKAQGNLNIEWVRDPDAPLDSDQIEQHYRDAMRTSSGSVKRSVGDIDAAFEEGARSIELEFYAPFLAHATMEPMNCTADVRNEKAEIWTSTQAPDIASVAVAKVTNVDLSDVVIHNQFIGGGFGRRLSQDFVAEAAEISYKLGGVVKLIWSREEDTKYDLYRPSALHKLKASINKSGHPIAWDHQIVSPKIMDWYVWDASPAMFPWAPKFMYPALGRAGLLTEGTPITPADTSGFEGAEDVPYDIAAINVAHIKADAGVPVTYWRSVGHSHTAFAVESFIDHLAFEAKVDAFAFRKQYLKNSPRLLSVLEAVAKAGSWGRNTEDGVYQGIAAHKSFGSYAAELVEIKIEHGEIRLLKVVCAIDCGLVVNPDIVKMQMESGIIFGATAALYGEITLKEGAVQQSNFHDYPLMRLNQAPEIITVIVNSDEKPTGVGEPGVPPIAPAIANALFKATGKRATRLPLKIGS